MEERPPGKAAGRSQWALGPEEQVSRPWGILASWCPPSGHIQEIGLLEGLGIDREGSHPSPTQASRNWGQTTGDVGPPDHMLGLHYGRSCALGEGPGPRVQPPADPGWSEAPWPGPAGIGEGHTQSSWNPPHLREAR